VSCEEELREQVKRLQAELKTKEDLRLSLEHKLAEEKAMRKLAEEERDSLGRDRMKAMNDLESLKVINEEKTLQVEKAHYWEELAVKTQAVSSKRLTDIKELKSQLKDVELELVKTKKVVKATQNVRTELNSVKIEAKALRTKLAKGEAKTEQLLESQKMMESHIQILDTANNSLSRNNLIHTERIREFQEQIDRAAAEAHWLRVEARQVGGDIAKYQRSMNNTDMFLKAIANRGSAFPPVID
jgi:chromosome segregation ATPase